MATFRNPETRLEAHLAFQREHGDLVELRVGPRSFLMGYHPAVAERVLHDLPDVYVKGSVVDELRPLLGNGLLISEGTFWRRQRRLMAPPFHPARLAGLAESMLDLTDSLATRWREAADAGRVLDVGQEMNALTMRIAARTLLGVELAAPAETLGEHLTFAFTHANRRAISPVKGPRWLPTRANRRTREALAYLDEVVLGVIAERRRADAPAGRPDLLQLLLEARDETGDAMDDRQVRDEVATMFVAGHETTSNALGWTFHLLAQHPEQAARLHEEVDRVLGDRPPTPADLPRLPFTTCVIEEVLRLRPPAFRIPRVCTADDAILGVRVPRGTVIGVSIEAIHRHPEFWNEPHRFDPDRFTPERSQGRHRFAYLPFGAGPRSCIGNAFALMELKLVLARLAQEFELALAPGARVVPVAAVTLRPAGLLMGVRRR